METGFLMQLYKRKNMGNSWAQEEKRDSDEFPDRHTHPEHRSLNNTSCSCSFCCSRSSVINCDRNEALMQVSFSQNQKQIAPNIWKVDSSTLQKTVSSRETESEATQCSYFGSNASKESIANNTCDLPDFSLQKDRIVCNTHSVIHEEHKYDIKEQDVCKSMQPKETVSALCLPSRESRSIDLNENFNTARIFQNELVCIDEEKEDKLELGNIRYVETSLANCDNVSPIFNNLTREILFGANLSESNPFGCENFFGNLHNFNTHIFSKAIMERTNTSHSLDVADLCRQSDLMEVSSEIHVLDDTLEVNTFLSDKNEKYLLPVSDDSLNAVEGIFTGLIDKVDTHSAIASFQWTEKSYSAIIYKNKIKYRERNVGKKLNIDELLVIGQRVTLHIKSNSKNKEGNLIASCLQLDVENREESEEQNYVTSPLYLTTINNTWGLSSIHAAIESVYNTWGTLSFMGGISDKKGIFIRENVYINDFNVPKESDLNLVLYNGMPVLCDVNSYNCDINIKLFWFVGEIVGLKNDVGVISFVKRGDKEKAVILSENLYVNREKSTCSDLYEVLQLGDMVAFLCIPYEMTEMRFKATYLLLCNDRESVHVNFDTSNDQYNYFIDLLSSCQTRCQRSVHSTIEIPSVPYNSANKPPDFNVFIQSNDNFRQAAQSFMQSLKLFKKFSMSDELQQNSYFSLLNALGTALVFGGLIWKEYTSNKFDTDASSAFDVNTIRFFDITGTVYEEGILISGEMKILFHVNDVYVNGERCTHLPVGADFHCTATELPQHGCRGETHFAWCLWQGTRPDVQHVFKEFELKKSDAITLQENKQYKGQVVAVYPPHAALVRLFIGWGMAPVVVFSNFLQDRMCPFSFNGNPWIIDYINIADYLNVSVHPTKKSNKVAKLGYQWTVVSARKTCSCEVKPHITRIFSKSNAKQLNGIVSFLCKSFGLFRDEGSQYGVFVKDFVMINNEHVGSNVTLADLLTHNSSVMFLKGSSYFFNEKMYYISVINVSGLGMAINSKCNTCSFCGKIDKQVVCPVIKHLNGVAGILTGVRDEDGLLEYGMYKAVFHKSRLFLSGKKVGSMQVLHDVIHEGMTFHFVAVVTDGYWCDIHTSHICTTVWDSQKPSINTVMESYITYAADGDMLEENFDYFGIVTDIAPPSIALVTIKTFGNSIPVLLYISNLAVGKEGTMCNKDDWVNDYLKIGDTLNVKIASKTKNGKFRFVSKAWKKSDATAVKNVECTAENKNTISENQNPSSSFENQILNKTHSEDERCDTIVNNTDILLSAENVNDCSISSVDPRSKGINIASESMETLVKTMEPSDVDSVAAEVEIVTHPVYNAFARDAQTLVSDIESLGSMLVAGSLLWKEFVSKELETTNDLSDCRFTDAEVTAIRPVSKSTAVLTVAGPYGPVEAFFNEIDAYNIDANSNDKIYCTAIKLPEIGYFKETHAVWLLWQGRPPAMHEVLSVFKTEYSQPLVLLDNVQYLGVIVALLPPHVGLMKIAVNSSVSVPVLIHVNVLTACKEMSCSRSSGSWIIDYVSVGDALTVSIESAKNEFLKEIGIRWCVKTVWRNNTENISSLSLLDDMCTFSTFRGVVSAVYSNFGVVTFETGGHLKRALFFKDQTNVNWQELKAVVAAKENYEVSFHVKPECFNPNSILWLASNITKIEECENCVPEDSSVGNGVDSFIQNKKFLAFVEKLEFEVGFAVFKLCGRYERAIFPYTNIYYNGAQIEPKSVMTVLRIDMQLSIKIKRITNSEQETVKFTAEYVEIRPHNEINGSETKAGVSSLTNLLVNKLNVRSELEVDELRILRALKGKIKYNELGTGIIEFKYRNEDYEVSFNQSTQILINAQGRRNLSDIWPTGTTVHFNLLHNNSMTELSVECVWETKKPKKNFFKKAPEFLPKERNRVKPGCMYHAKVIQLKKFSFVAEIKMEDVVTTVFVPNVSFHPFPDTEKLSRGECVSLHLNKGDVVYVVVQRSRSGEENEWFATEAWKEAADNTPVPSTTLQLLRNNQTGEEAKIATLSSTEGQLQTVDDIVLSFVQEDVYLYGVPLKNVDLTDILSVGDTVNFSIADGSLAIGPNVFVSKVWIGCYEILNFAGTYGAIARYRSSRGLKPHVFEELMKELGRHRQVQPGNLVEWSLQTNENILEAMSPVDDILKNSVGKSEQHDVFSRQSIAQKTENKKLSPNDITKITVPAHSSKTYASLLKMHENIVPCGSKGTENLQKKDACVLDSDVRGIMEMSLNEIMCTYHGNNSSEFSSQVMRNVESMVQKELVKKILPAAISNTVKHFAVDTNETFVLEDANQRAVWVSRIANMWNSRLQVLLENHFHFSDDELHMENDLELPSNSKSSCCEMCERTNDTLQIMPEITESGTQTTSTGNVIYLNIYADANDEVNHS